MVEQDWNDALFILYSKGLPLRLRQCYSALQLTPMPLLLLLINLIAPLECTVRRIMKRELISNSHTEHT
jgi:hypothetical protein